MSTNDEKLKLIEQISICKEVIDMMKHPGWIKIVEPILKAMIADIAGGETPDGRMVYGKMVSLPEGASLDRVIGYRHGLVDYFNRIHDHKLQLSRKEEELGKLENSGKDEPIKEHPMEGGPWDNTDEEKPDGVS